jgi:hypothetical protein
MFFEESPFFRRVLAGVVLPGCLLLFYRLEIAPVRWRAQDFLRRRADLQKQIDSGHKAIEEARVSEGEAAKAASELNRLLSGMLSGSSVMVSFPERIKEHFSRFGLPLTVVRLNTAQDEPDLPGFQRVYWSVGVPIPEKDRTFTGLLLAVAELEQANRFVNVLDFTLQPDAEDSRRRTAGVNVEALVPK